MKITKMGMVTAAVALAAITAGSVMLVRAQSPAGGHGWFHRRDHMAAVMRQLDLTDAQKTQIKQIRDSHKATLQPLVQQLRTQRQALRQAEQGPTFDQAAATQAFTEMAPIQAQVMGERFKMRQEIEGVLTPEQKAKLQQIRTQFQSKHQAAAAKG